MIGFWLIIIVLALALSVASTVVIFKLVGAKAIGKKPDNPLSRGITEINRPISLSGILLVPVTLLSTLLALGILSFWSAPAVKTTLLESGIDPFFLLCALMIMYLTGMCKDLSRVRESLTLIAEGICAALIILSGLRISSLQGLFSMEDLSSRSSAILTILVILVTINAVTVVVRDLKAGKGICSLALLYFGLSLLSCGEYIFSALAAAALGCNIVGGNLNKRNPLFHLGSTGGLAMGIIIPMLAIRVCQDPSPVTASLTSRVNPVILGLTPVIILTAIALYDLGHKDKDKDKSEN